VIATPLGAIREHADVPPLHLSLPRLDIGLELLDGVPEHSLAAKISFNFEHRGAGLHVDPPAFARRRFEGDVLKVIFRELEGRVQEESTDIRLNRRFGTPRLTVGETGQEITQLLHLSRLLRRPLLLGKAAARL
jgi:hypothetical protein